MEIINCLEVLRVFGVGVGAGTSRTLSTMLPRARPILRRVKLEATTHLSVCVRCRKKSNAPSRLRWSRLSDAEITKSNKNVRLRSIRYAACEEATRGKHQFTMLV